MPCPSPGGLPNPGIELRSPSLQADSLPSEPPRKPSCGQVPLPIYLLPLGTCALVRFSEHAAAAAAAAKSLQSCPTLCNHIDGSPPVSPDPGVLQARKLEWVAVSFSNAGNWKVKVKSLSRVRLLATPGTAAYQAPPSMGFSRQEYWSGVPLPSPLRVCFSPIFVERRERRWER